MGRQQLVAVEEFSNHPLTKGGTNFDNFVRSFFRQGKKFVLYNTANMQDSIKHVSGDNLWLLRLEFHGKF